MANPVITIDVTPIDNPENIEYIDTGVTAVDEFFVDITGDIVRTGATDVEINLGVANENFGIFYNVKDGAGQFADQETRIVNITEAIPVIKLLGSDVVDIPHNETYVDDGATAKDGSGVDITSTIARIPADDTGINAIDTITAPFSFTITYDVSEAGLDAIQVSRDVNVLVAVPIITILGDNPANIAENVVYVDKGATAEDFEDGTITPVRSGPDDATITAGTDGDSYTITYTATDIDGNITELDRIINIGVLKSPPIITINGALNVVLPEGEIYIDSGSYAVDSDGVALSEPIRGGDSDTTISGGFNGDTFQISYTVTDSFGITTIEYRDFTIVAPLTVGKPIILEADIWAIDPLAEVIPVPTTKSEEGWRYGEKPYNAFANKLQQRTDKALVHINQNGVPEWDGATTYNFGALALFSGNLFHSLLAGNTNNLSTDPIWWAAGAGGTGAGMLWSTATNYVIGDMVSYGGPPYTYYTALTINTASNPTGGLPDWEEYGTDYHDSVAVTYTPVVGTEYPSTAADTLGAVWYVTGLGVTGVVPNIYTYTSGDLSGQSVRDDDKLIWVAGITGLEKWHLTPFPRINNEQGGITWIAQVDYAVGDQVTDAGDLYICTTAHTSVGFVGDAVNWNKSSGAGTGVPASTAYDPGYTYLEGDIVSIGDQLYIAPAGGAGPGVLPPAAPWIAEGTSRYVNVTGDTMTGNLTIPNASAAGHAMNRTTSDGRYVNVTGDAMTGALAMGNNKITGLAKAAANDDAVSADAYAGTTLGGTLKARLAANTPATGEFTLFLTNDGSNP